MVFIHLFIQKLLNSTSGFEVGYYVRLLPADPCLPVELHCPRELSVIIEMSIQAAGGGHENVSKMVPASRSLQSL